MKSPQTSIQAFIFLEITRTSVVGPLHMFLSSHYYFRFLICIYGLNRFEVPHHPHRGFLDPRAALSGLVLGLTSSPTFELPKIQTPFMGVG